MPRVKPMVLLALIAVLGAGACTEMTGPENGVCPVTGGPGVCGATVQSR